jgi:hypothetical protein
MAETYVNLNHGSYGSAPREVIESQFKCVHDMESRADAWFRGGYQVLAFTVFTGRNDAAGGAECSHL